MFILFKVSAYLILFNEPRGKTRSKFVIFVRRVRNAELRKSGITEAEQLRFGMYTRTVLNSVRV